jgi:peptidoglycan hydrolase CwlO-like protein
VVLNLLSKLCKNSKQDMKNLEQQIEELNENLAKQLPTEVLEVFGKSIQDLKAPRH